jgi:predicted ATPase
VGKTSVALTLAHDLKERFDGDVCVFDVGGVFNPDLLAAGVASVFEIPAPPRGEATGHVSSFGRRRMLLVLDGCEVSVDLTAALAERLFREGPEVHLLATSREALRAEGEHVHRLSPLPYPAVGEGQTAEDAQRFAAVQLFVDRVAASPSGFTLTDAEAPQVSEICRKLDGLALAIELAAGRVNAYGVADVARQLETEFVLMWPGRRSAVPRHHTLSAAFGWSHKRLSAAEQTAFRRLGVFAAAFTLDMATDALAGGLTPVAEARELLGSLVSKSLVQFNPEGRHGAYRLLVVTRSYALDRLAEADEIRQMSERHARLICRLVEADEPGAPAGEAPDANDLFEDISAALEWSLSPDGDPGMAVSLTMASAPVWLRAGLLVECRYWIRRVLGAIGPPMLDDDRRLAIQSILGQAAARACAGAPRVNALE